MKGEKKRFHDFLDDHNMLFSKLDKIEQELISSALLMSKAIGKGNKLLICGNGGSAADAQHFAAEMIGRFERERRALPAIALTTDTSILTALSNDYGYDMVFSRQVEALAKPGDILIGISTSGNSSNVILATEAAKEMGVKNIGLLGRDGGKLAALVDVPVIVPHGVTARIQEAHIFIIHFWCAYIEKELFGND